MKQVIVMRNDLNMRKGKMIAQGAHASLAAVIKGASVHPNAEPDPFVAIPVDDSLLEWLAGRFTKIALSINSEDALKAIVHDAEAAGLRNVLITDAGLTEFNGVPTVTCAAIGPAPDDEINKITGHLKLL